TSTSNAVSSGVPRMYEPVTTTVSSAIGVSAAEAVKAAAVNTLEIAQASARLLRFIDFPRAGTCVPHDFFAFVYARIFAVLRHPRLLATSLELLVRLAPEARQARYPRVKSHFAKWNNSVSDACFNLRRRSRTLSAMAFVAHAVDGREIRYVDGKRY